MSTLPRKLAAPRQGRRRDSGERRGYIPFRAAPQLDELEGRALVQRHLAWLLANIDWFAGGGKATLHMLNHGLRNDLLALGQLGPADKRGQLELIEMLQQRLDVYENAIANISATWHELFRPETEPPRRDQVHRFIRESLARACAVSREINQERTARIRREVGDQYSKQSAGQG